MSEPNDIYSLARAVAAVDRIRGRDVPSLGNGADKSAPRWSASDQAKFDLMIERVRARGTEKAPGEPKGLIVPTAEGYSSR